MDLFTGFFDFIYSIIATAQDWFMKLLVDIGGWIVLWSIKLKYYSIQFAWDVAKSVLEQINITGVLNQYWRSIDSEILAYITWLRIPDALNLILNAYVTRYVLGVFGK